MWQRGIGKSKSKGAVWLVMVMTGGAALFFAKKEGAVGGGSCGAVLIKLSGNSSSIFGEIACLGTLVGKTTLKSAVFALNEGFRVGPLIMESFS